MEQLFDSSGKEKRNMYRKRNVYIYIYIWICKHIPIYLKKYQFWHQCCSKEFEEVASRTWEWGECPSETPLSPSALLQVKVAAAAGTAEKKSWCGKAGEAGRYPAPASAMGESPAFQQMFGSYSSWAQLLYLPRTSPATPLLPELNRSRDWTGRMQIVYCAHKKQQTEEEIHMHVHTHTCGHTTCTLSW